MCLACHPAFAEALRTLDIPAALSSINPSRRRFLKTATAATAGGLVCEATGSGAARAQARSFQDMMDQLDPRKLPRVTIYRAKEIVTLDPAKPTATAVAILVRER